MERSTIVRKKPNNIGIENNEVSNDGIDIKDDEDKVNVNEKNNGFGAKGNGDGNEGGIQDNPPPTAYTNLEKIINHW